MNKIFLSIIFLITFATWANAGDNKKHEINWMTFEQAEAKMKEHPKKVIVDVYTGWCGWCKKLDRDIYTNDSLVDYVNEYFYAVKFDAEQKTTIHFVGKTWDYAPEKRVNDLAYALLQGKMSYPTTVFMDENFKDAQPVPGYLELFQMENVMKYFGTDSDHKMEYTKWQHDFKPAWKPN